MLEIRSTEQAEQALRSARQIMIERVQLCRQLLSGSRSILMRIQKTGWGRWTDAQVQQSLDGADDAADAVLGAAKILVEGKVVTAEQIEGVEWRHDAVAKKIEEFRGVVKDGFSKQDAGLFSGVIFGVSSAMEVILDCQAIASELRNVWTPPAPAVTAGSPSPSASTPSAPPESKPAESKASVWPWIAAGATALFVVPTLGGLGEFVKFVGPTAGFALGMAILNPKKREVESRDHKVLRLLRLRQRMKFLR